MNRTHVLLAQARNDPIASELEARLQASPRFALYSGKHWSDNALVAHLERRLPIEWSLAVLVCSGPRNERLSREMLARDPTLVVVRIDIGSDGTAASGIVNVDLVQHLQLDPQQLGFERLLSAMHYLVEHHGAGDSQRLARFLVVDDPASIYPLGARFVQVRAANEPLLSNRKLPDAAIHWLNALLIDHFTRCPMAEGEQGSFFTSRTRALALLEALASGDQRGEESSTGDLLTRAEAALVSCVEAKAPNAEPLALLRRRLGLPHDSLHSIIICLAPELDIDYQLIYGHIHDHMSCRCATPGLIDALGVSRLAPLAAASIGPLVHWRLLSPNSSEWPAADEALRVDPVVVQWLFVGGDALVRDPRVKAVTRSEPWQGRDLLVEATDDADCACLARHISDIGTPPCWLVITGPDIKGWRAVLEAAALRADMDLLRVNLSNFTSLDPTTREDVAIRIARVALLMSICIVIDCECELIDPSALDQLIKVHSEGRGTCVLIAADTSAVSDSLPRGRWTTRTRSMPGVAARARQFSVVLNALEIADEHEATSGRIAERMAAAYPLAVDSLSAAASLAQACTDDDATPQQRLQRLTAACRQVAAPDILRLARRIEPLHSLKDVIVPADRLALFSEIIANARYGRTVLEQWGFGDQLPYGQGVAALFAGPSGTGKTMAAQAIARELGVDVFSVDLSRIVSKYIGETEKHLDSVILDAERSGAVLVFDEADALFGKRSEVKDAHDRYANMEVAFLLQRMEAFSGLAILTTNSRQSVDAAFVRRLRFIVDFPRPDAAAREQIWRRCMPASAPMEEDIDWRLLARFDLSGGLIRQVTLRAAFLAASETPARIGMKQLLSALRSELIKLGMQTAEQELAAHERLMVPALREAA